MSLVFRYHTLKLKLSKKTQQSLFPHSLSLSLSFPSRFLQLDLLFFLHNVADILVRPMYLGPFDLIICGATIVQIQPLGYEISKMEIK